MTVTYLPRAQWGAGSLGAGHRVPESQFIGLAAHHTVTNAPVDGTISAIVNHMKFLQRARPDLGNDVPYSFVVFETSNAQNCVVAEGRGLGVTGAHTAGYNSTRLGVAVAGNTSTRPVTLGMLDGINWVGRLLTSPSTARLTFGHRDVKATNCPGDSFYSNLHRVQPPFHPLVIEDDDMTPEQAKTFNYMADRLIRLEKMLGNGDFVGNGQDADTDKTLLAILDRAFTQDRGDADIRTAIADQLINIGLERSTQFQTLMGKVDDIAVRLDQDA